jgi:outer membrane immunogenic protein
MLTRLMQTGIGAAALVAAASLSAQAADMPVKAPYAPPMAAPSWTGFYIGGFIGAGWGTDEANLTSLSFTTLPGPVPLASPSISGVLGGGQIGYNYQSGWVVLGVEGDFAGTDIKGSAPCVVVFTCSASDNWLATASGRIGGLVGNQTLVYVKGGGAWENTKYTGADPLGAVLTPGGSISATKTNTGWLLGMGVEYAFTNHWRGFIEYNYMDFGTNTVSFSGFGGSGTAALTDKLSVMKAGVNYAF